ncbi:phytoene/squalene synthase family protein [Oharaeibacter diazotrophicus]|uniref:Phytoene synthase n=1 Tax=Oharaeibacter diazotrophicus TaxID=1920512 RepID=A0A4R6RKJ1_9HYPH|nr:phytoene/squalene synthase family protein [Oharaeibacter diazotrophicus]TDP86994.1 phytoene synthase [Oharaeibacter diazotrophicus]BBE71063.1 all-trans-phytoene synthase [Pleomorphomonas sp. SM30]GLS77814.1 phytoene synthase [Oharaeibacter diazotrophicus]
MASERTDAAYAAAEASVRSGDRDRWLADLFLPAESRRHVFALHAFSLEIARVRDVVREPMPGEIRLQWWVDALEGAGHGAVESHPIAAALIDTVDRFRLPRRSLANLVEARRFDLYDDAMPSLGDLEGYTGETASVLFLHAATVLCAGEDAGAADAAGHAGVAYAITGLMRALPLHARRNQVYLPEDVLRRHGASADDVRAMRDGPALRGALGEMREHARHHLARAVGALCAIDPRARPAFVGLGLVEPWLRALEKAAPFGAPADVSGWRKPVALWRFSRRIAR